MTETSSKSDFSGLNVGGVQAGQINTYHNSKDRLQEVIDWFSPVDFAQRQIDVLRHEYVDSKASFFSLKEYQAWKSGDSQVLWCQGKAGSGKTVLTSLIFDDLQRTETAEETGIACIFCDKQQGKTQTPDKLIASLWPRFSRVNDKSTLPQHMADIYQTHTKARTRPSLEKILSIVQTALQDLKKAYILIDGLDELTDDEQRQTFIDSMESLLSSSKNENARVQVLITSRFLRDILPQAVSVEIRAQDEEIKATIRKRLQGRRPFTSRDLSTRVSERPDLQQRIVDTIAAKAEGMFLFADLHLKFLASSTNERALTDLLGRLPETLDTYYQSSWAQVSDSEDLGLRTIAWLYFAKRLLTVDELRHALAVQVGDKSLQEEGLSSLSDIVKYCHGLVVADESGKALRFMHSTVRDFFAKKEGDPRLKDKPAYLANTCLTYLSFEYFQGETCKYASSAAADIFAAPGTRVQSREILSFRLQQFPFLLYAADNWGYHASGETESKCLDLIVPFLLSNNELSNAHMVYSQVFHPSFKRHVAHNFRDLFPLRVAVSFGLEKTAYPLVTAIASTISTLEQGGRALVTSQMLLSLLEAIDCGRISIVRALLEAGTDPLNSGNILPLTTLDKTLQHRNQRPKTALDRCCLHDQLTMASLMIEKGAITTEQTMEYAINSANHDLLGMYLEVASRATDRSKEVTRMLNFAAKNGNLTAIEFCLKNGADIEHREPQRCCTALRIAVAHGQAPAVEFLIENGANISAELPLAFSDDDDKYNETLLQQAVTSLEIFEERLRVVNDTKISGYTSAEIQGPDAARFERRLTEWLDMDPIPVHLMQKPDFIAAIREDSNHEKIINNLLRAGADVSVRGNRDENILHLSVISMPRTRAILQHLKHHPHLTLSVDTVDSYGRTPLHHAAAACNSSVMELLIEYGADIMAKDYGGLSILHFAAGSPTCMRLALDNGWTLGTRRNTFESIIQFVKSTKDPNDKAIQMLEQALRDSGHEVQAEDIAAVKENDLLDPDDEIFGEIYRWLILKRVTHNILCKDWIWTRLKNSQRNAAFENAGRDGKVQSTERKWKLIISPEHQHLGIKTV